MLHSGAVTNAFWLAVGIAAGIAGATLLVGARHFVKSYHLVAAFFREADDVGYRAVMDYQESEWEPARLEGLLSGAGRFVYRRHMRQFARAFPVARSVATIGCAAGALGAFFLSPGAFPSWVVAIIPAVLVVVLERPFGRLDDASLGAAGDAFLPLAAPALERARLVWSGFEIFRLALPYAVVAGAARAWTDAPLTGLAVAVACLSVSGAVAGLIALARSLGATGRGSATAVSVIGCVVLAGAAAIDAWIAVGIGAVLMLVSIARLRMGTR